MIGLVLWAHHPFLTVPTEMLPYECPPPGSLVLCYEAVPINPPQPNFVLIAVDPRTPLHFIACESGGCREMKP